MSGQRTYVAPFYYRIGIENRMTLKASFLDCSYKGDTTKTEACLHDPDQLPLDSVSREPALTNIRL
jgi:hypothetical protein